jgi:hypothetical protein
MTLKIAAGVFLGVIAAFLAIKATGWIKEGITSIKLQGADLVVKDMTPLLAVVRCGIPEKDVLDDHGSTRMMYFQKPFPGVVLRFHKLGNGEWYFDWMTPGGFLPGSTIPEGEPIFESQDAEGRLIWDKAWKEIYALPCLEGKH